jgi:hypothetical protein
MILFFLENCKTKNIHNKVLLKKTSKTKLGSTFSKWTKIKMSKIDFIQIIFFFPIFSKNENSIFKKISIRCINANKIFYFKKVTFFEIFGGRTFLDIYLDIFQLCQNGVFLISFLALFYTHNCRDPDCKINFDTAR